MDTVSAMHTPMQTRARSMGRAAQALCALALCAGAPAHAWSRHESISTVFPLSAALPNPRLTPGAINPAVTQANIRQTICVRGYSESIRPPESYTEPLKRELIARYGYADRRLGHFELDHLVSLELGGNPTAPSNLWPQPHDVAGGWGSYTKDHLENTLHRLVCRGQLPLAQAQYDIAHDWIAAYKRYVGGSPARSRERY